MHTPLNLYTKGRRGEEFICPVFDKFGEDTAMMTVNENTRAATGRIQISPTFVGLLAQFAKNAGDITWQCN